MPDVYPAENLPAMLIAPGFSPASLYFMFCQTSIQWVTGLCSHFFSTQESQQSPQSSPWHICIECSGRWDDTLFTYFNKINPLSLNFCLTSTNKCFHPLLKKTMTCLIKSLNINIVCCPRRYFNHISCAQTGLG